MADPNPQSADASDWSPCPPTVQAIHARLLRVVPAIAQNLRPEATFPECGGDSLDFVELMCAVETDYGVRLTTDEIAALPTIRALLELIDRRATRRPAP